MDRIIGFEIGADDYITKPFSVRELILRVQAVLRRGDPPAAQSGPLKMGLLTIDPDRHQVLVGSRNVELTATEFKLLHHLAGNSGRVQTREVLLDRVWGYSFEGYSRTVDTHVRRLRQKLGEAQGLIETVRGVGYTLQGGGLNLNLSFKNSILVGFLAVVVVTLAFTGFLLHFQLKPRMIEQYEASLAQQMVILKEVLKDRWSPGMPQEAVDRLAEEMGHKLGLRVTLIEPGGVVLGDTKVPHPGPGRPWTTTAPGPRFSRPCPRDRAPPSAIRPPWGWTSSMWPGCSKPPATRGW